MTAGGLVTVAASSSVLVCMVDVLAVAAVVTELDVMDFKIEPNFSVQNPPARRAGWLLSSCSQFATSSCGVAVIPKSLRTDCCILS